MNIMDANGAIACAECAKNARNERDQLQSENAKLRELLAELYEDLIYDWTPSKQHQKEEIVRCRDCAKWSFFDVEDGKRIGDCSEWTHLDGFSHATNEDGFCAWACRKEQQ